MNQLEAAEVTALLVAAYQVNWKPTKEGIELYRDVLAVPELDAEVTRTVVMEIIRSDERFAPPVGVVYSAALERSRDKFHRQVFPGLVREMIESSHADGSPLLDSDKAEAAIQSHPAIRRFGCGGGRPAWMFVCDYMEKHAGDFLPKQVPTRFRQSLPGPGVERKLLDVNQTQLG